MTDPRFWKNVATAKALSSVVLWKSGWPHFLKLFWEKNKIPSCSMLQKSVGQKTIPHMVHKRRKKVRHLSVETCRKAWYILLKYSFKQG
jgi:hypothetical protein